MSSSSRVIFRAIRGWHKLSIAISATAILLLFSQQPLDYRAALNEAHTLRALDIKDYERFIRGFIGQGRLLPSSPGTSPQSWPKRITNFLNTKMGQNVIPGDIPNPTTNIDIILEYERPPVNETIAEWVRWIESTKPAEYYLPDWSTAQLSASRDEMQSPIVRHFSVEPSIHRRYVGEYTFRAYLDLRITSSDRSTNIEERRDRDDWWSELKGHDVLGEDKAHVSDLGVDRWIIEGDVNGMRKSVSGPSVNRWLRERGIWLHLAVTENLGEAVLPEIRKHRLRLEEMTLPAAISYMERQHTRIESVNLLGLSVPGSLFLIAIPLAYLLAHLSLLIEIRHLNALRKSRNDLEALWMGFYTDGLAKWVTILSIAIIPIVLSLGLLLRYRATVDVLGIAVCVTTIGIGAVIQWMVLRAVAAVRRSIELPTEGE